MFYACGGAVMSFPLEKEFTLFSVVEAQEDPPRGHNGPKRKKSSSSSSSPVENKSKL